jgi:RNA polymerase sigma factor (sigma-70 family)
MRSAATVVPPDVLRVVRNGAFRAWRSLRSYGFDRQDTEQELIFHYWTRRVRFDPAKASTVTFASSICRRRALHMVETATAMIRGGMTETVQLSDRISADSTLTHFDTVSQDEANIRMGWSSRPGAELLALHIDVDRVISGLPGELVVVARWIAGGVSAAEIARGLGLSRATIHRRIQKLRQIFRGAGLDRYLKRREA